MAGGWWSVFVLYQLCRYLYHCRWKTIEGSFTRSETCKATTPVHQKKKEVSQMANEDAIIAYDGWQSWMTNSLMQSSQVDLSSKGKFFQLHSLWLWCWGHYFLEGYGGILPQRKNKVAKTCSPLFWARISITVNCLKWVQREEVVNYN